MLNVIIQCFKSCGLKVKEIYWSHPNFNFIVTIYNELHSCVLNIITHKLFLCQSKQITEQNETNSVVLYTESRPPFIAILFLYGLNSYHWPMQLPILRTRFSTILLNFIFSLLSSINFWNMATLYRILKKISNFIYITLVSRPFYQYSNFIYFSIIQSICLHKFSYIQINKLFRCIVTGFSSSHFV